jgi:N-hydroxyarylamine O-acetyltransferase
VLDDERLFKKIVENRRGGFCYELNSVFAQLLRSLGFNVTMLSGGVMSEDGNFGPNFDHMTLMVEMEERWLADVGFGDSFRKPIRLDERSEQQQGNDSYRIDSDGESMIYLRFLGGKWKPQYLFSLEPRQLSDYGEMCHYHQTSPKSHFTRNRVCTLATPEGRITVSGQRLIITAEGKRTERELANEEEYQSVLRDYFGVTITKS